MLSLVNGAICLVYCCPRSPKHWLGHLTILVAPAFVLALAWCLIFGHIAFGRSESVFSIRVPNKNFEVLSFFGHDVMTCPIIFTNAIFLCKNPKVSNAQNFKPHLLFGEISICSSRQENSRIPLLWGTYKFQGQIFSKF